MSRHGDPIGRPVKLASAALGALLITIGLGAAILVDGEEGSGWWVPMVLGGLFLLPLFSGAPRVGEGAALRRRFHRARYVEHLMTGGGVAGAIAIDWLHGHVFRDPGPLIDHPVLGPAMLMCSTLFLAGIVAQLRLAYLGAKAEAAEAMEREVTGRRP